MPTSKPSSASSSSTVPTSGTSNRAENLRTFIKSFEGGYANVPGHSGGPTKAGVTLGTWQSLGHDKNGDGVIDAKDVKLLQDSDQAHVFKSVWDSCKAD
jgi:lysozyme family protein